MFRTDAVMGFAPLNPTYELANLPVNVISSRCGGAAPCVRPRDLSAQLRVGWDSFDIAVARA
jgi:hypothetical protein